MKGNQMATRKVHHDIIYWCEYALVVEVTTFSNEHIPPETQIVFGGAEDTTTAECEAYIAGAKSWMREELQYEES